MTAQSEICVSLEWYTKTSNRCLFVAARWPTSLKGLPYAKCSWRLGTHQEAGCFLPENLETSPESGKRCETQPHLKSNPPGPRSSLFSRGGLLQYEPNEDRPVANSSKNCIQTVELKAPNRCDVRLYCVP